LHEKNLPMSWLYVSATVVVLFAVAHVMKLPRRARILGTIKVAVGAVGGGVLGALIGSDMGIAGGFGAVAATLPFAGVGALICGALTASKVGRNRR